MGAPKRTHTEESLIKLAKEYKTRNEFAKADYGAYKTACRRRILDKICKHMPDHASGPQIPDDVLLKKLEKFKNLSLRELLMEDRALYACARLRFGNDVFNSMKTNRRYTDDELIEEAKKYKTKKEFREADSSAYQLMLARKLMDLVFSKSAGRLAS